MSTVLEHTPMQSRRSALPLLALAGALLAPGIAAAGDGKSFVENFDTIDQGRWYVSDGWNNGPHQNCTWSNKLLDAKDGVLTLRFEKAAAKDRDYACAEIQTKQRFSYGTYEARMKTDTGIGPQRRVLHLYRPGRQTEARRDRLRGADQGHLEGAGQRLHLRQGQQ